MLELDKFISKVDEKIKIIDKFDSEELSGTNADSDIHKKIDDHYKERKKLLDELDAFIQANLTYENIDDLFVNSKISDEAVKLEEVFNKVDGLRVFGGEISPSLRSKEFYFRAMTERYRDQPDFYEVKRWVKKFTKHNKNDEKLKEKISPLVKWINEDPLSKK